MSRDPEPTYQLTTAQIVRTVHDGKVVDVLIVDIVRDGTVVGTHQVMPIAEAGGPGRVGWRLLTGTAAFDASLDVPTLGFRSSMRDKDNPEASM